MRAMKEVGGDLKAAVDPSDTVGVMDSHFPDARFFVEFERFDRHLDKIRRQGAPVEFISICSPNYMHDAHVRHALRADANAICEKPLVLNPWNLDALDEIAEETGRRINTILQLRLHPAIIALREKIESGPKDKIYNIDLTYITSRGRWYHTSWKGDETKSGGIATNIGVHFFDMLSYLFGNIVQNVVHYKDADRSAGWLEFPRARARWFLSISRSDLPSNTPEGQSTYRSITIDGEEIEFSGGFTDLHTASYHKIVNGAGFSLNDVRPSIEAVSHIRTASTEPRRGERHPFVNGYAGAA